MQNPRRNTALQVHHIKAALQYSCLSLCFWMHNSLEHTKGNSSLTSFTGSFSSLSQFVQQSHPFRGLVRQILLGFSLGSKHMLTRGIPYSEA